MTTYLLKPPNIYGEDSRQVYDSLDNDRDGKQLWKSINASKPGIDGAKAVYGKTALEIYIHAEDRNSDGNDSSLSKKGLVEEVAIETLDFFRYDDSDSDKIRAAILQREMIIKAQIASKATAIMKTPARRYSPGRWLCNTFRG